MEDYKPLEIETVDVVKAQPLQEYSALVRQGIKKLAVRKVAEQFRQERKQQLLRVDKHRLQAKQGNQKKMVGDGKAEKIGAVVGGVAGGIAGGVLDGPLPVGDIVGGIAGSKVGGKIGRQVDKMRAKRAEKVSEATYPSDFVNPDGSKRAVAKKKTGRPVQHDQAMSGGRRKTVDEEASDAMKDRRLERGGVGGNTNYKNLL